MSEAPVLAVRGLHKRYGRQEALAGIDLEVGAGELVGLLGPNGAGKSTLTKISCGLVRPSQGRVEVLGAPAGAPSARAALGYLAELFRFPGWCTATELLELHQRLSGSSGGAAERAELLDLVELGDVGAKRVEEMSKGMQQRLGIAQALVGEPGCCCSTSRPAPWTRSGGGSSAGCWRSCAAAASPSCSTRTC
jgi:ABC-2 type transport system ATP-binding protein